MTNTLFMLFRAVMSTLREWPDAEQEEFCRVWCQLLVHAGATQADLDAR